MFPPAAADAPIPGAILRLQLIYQWLLSQANGRAALAGGNGVSVAWSLDADMEEERRLAAMVCSLENKDGCLMCGS